jgi:hypothetical protein
VTDNIVMTAKRYTLANALRVAADQYDSCAAQSVTPRLTEQFKRQALEARELAAAIEEADVIRLGD